MHRAASPAAGSARPEGGVALLIVLVVLFIVAVLMVDITLTATTARRAARNASSDFLMDAAIEGRFPLAVAQLRYDSLESDSPDDRWAREEYTTFEAPAAEEGTTGEEEGVRLLGDSDEVTVTVTIEDEERKFNLNLLVAGNSSQKEEARERFAVLLDRYREGTPLDLSRTRADEIRDRVVEYLERAAGGEGETGKVPVPRSWPWRLLTPDELRNVDGLEDPSRGLTAEGILYDARDPEAAREYMEDPENTEPPEVHPGLLRYVTLWSGDAWSGTAKGQKEVPAESVRTWLLINPNTAEKPVLETLFWRTPSDMALAERIIEYRGTDKEGSTKAEEGLEVAPDEALPTHQYFEKVEDLDKVEGLQEARTRGKFEWNAVCTVKSATFSLDFFAKHDRATKQVRYIVRRNAQGVQTLLREVRADPRFEEEPEDGEAADDATAGR